MALWFLIVALTVIGTVVVGAVWGFVRLVSKEKTRPVALGILGAVVVAFVVLPALMWYIAVSSYQGSEYQSSELPRRTVVETITRSQIPLDDRPAVGSTAAGAPARIKLAPTEATAASRPAWVDEPARRVGGVYRTTVASDPFTSKLECDEAINPKLREITDQYIDTLCGRQGAGELVDMDVIEIRNKLCTEEWTESIDKPYGRMVQVHVLMEFDETTGRDLRARFEKAFARWRLLQAGGGALAVFAALGILYGYLTLDTATKGYYTKRLQAAAALAAIGAIAAAARLLVA